MDHDPSGCTSPGNCPFTRDYALCENPTRAGPSILAAFMFPLLLFLFVWGAPCQPGRCGDGAENAQAEMAAAIQEEDLTHRSSTDQPLRKSLSAGESQAYKVYVRSGEFWEASVTARNVEIASSVSDPDRHTLETIRTPYGVQEQVPMLILAAKSGYYTQIMHGLRPELASEPAS